MNIKEETKTEKTKTSTLEKYPINDLKSDVNKIVYHGLANTWRTRDDPYTSDVVYHIGSKRKIIIAEIKNKESYMNDYSDFLSFPANFRFIGEEEELFENKSTETNETEKIEYTNEYIGDKDWLLSEGKIRELAYYGKNKETGLWHLHHSFNIYYAPNLYIRLYPEWYGGNKPWWADISENELNVNYEHDRQNLIPIASQLSKICPLKSEYLGEYTIYDIEKDLNSIYGGYFAFLKSELKDINSYESYKGSNIKVVVDKTKPNMVNYVNLDYRNIVIEELKDKKIETLDEFKNYVEEKFRVHKEDAEDKRKSFKDEFNKDYKEQYAIDHMGPLYEYYEFIDLSKTTELDSDEFSIIEKGMIESIYVYLDNYLFNYKMAYKEDKLESSTTTSKKKDQFLDFKDTISILCKPNLVIHLTENKIEKQNIGEDYEKGEVEIQIEEIRNKLILEGKKIVKVCS